MAQQAQIAQEENKLGAKANGYTVSLHDGEDANGLAGILHTLLSQNFQNFPSRVRIAWRMPRPVAVHSTDTDSDATVIFGKEGTLICNGIVGKPSVTTFATVDQILDVSQVKMVGAGLVPVGFFTKRGLHILADIARHRLVVKGLLKHPITTHQFISLVSIKK